MSPETSKGAFNLQTPANAAASGKNYLLAIAIDDYLHCTKLRNAVLDVEAFIALLTSRYNFEPERITRLTNAEATKKAIEQALIRLTKTVQPQDNLVIYFSGHGRYDEQLGGNWVPVEAGAGDDDWTDYLSNDLVKSYLNRINSFHTFLLADSCFSGTLFIDKGREKFTGDRRDSEPSRWGLTSGKKEIVSDGTPGKHSPFAAAVLDVLGKADQPPGVMRLCDLVLEKVAANAMQTPMGSPLAVKGHQGGQFVFHFRADEGEEWQAVKDSESIAALQGFLNRHPHGNYVEEARRRIAWLEDGDTLERIRTKPALVTFMSQTAFSDLRQAARQRLKILEDEEFWQSALRRQRLTDFIDYLDRFGEDGAHVEEAQAKIVALQETENRREKEKDEAERRENEARAKRQAEEEDRRKKAAAAHRQAEEERQKREAAEAERLQAEAKRQAEEERQKKETATRQQAQVAPTIKIQVGKQKSESSPPPPKPAFPVWKIALPAAVLLVVVLLIWQPWKPAGASTQDPPNEQKQASSEEQAFKIAENAATIPAWKKFLHDHPGGDHHQVASDSLSHLNRRVEKLLKQAEVYVKIENPAAAKNDLEEVLKIDPENTEAKRLLQKL